MVSTVACSEAGRDIERRGDDGTDCDPSFLNKRSLSITCSRPSIAGKLDGRLRSGIAIRCRLVGLMRNPSASFAETALARVPALGQSSRLARASVADLEVTISGTDKLDCACDCCNRVKGRSSE